MTIWNKETIIDYIEEHNHILVSELDYNSSSATIMTIMCQECQYYRDTKFKMFTVLLVFNGKTQF